MDSANIKLLDWNEVEQFIDNSSMRITPSYFERIVQGNYPLDAFSKGQLASKAWLLSELFRIVPLKPHATVAILGSWIGSIVEFMHNGLIIDRIYGIDMDPHAIELSEQLNQKWVQDSWKYKGVVADVTTLHTAQMEFETAGELITVCPDWVINTSCEHMDSHWFDTANADQLIIMQTNDSPQYDGHINICASEFDMWDKYPMSERIFSGVLETPAYTRFMQIGYK
jgi:hypothetical protein